MILLNGKKLSEEILRKVKREIKRSHLKLKLAVVQVGENPVSQIFISQKKKACGEIGINFKLFKFPVSIKNFGLKKELRKFAKILKIAE